MKAAIGTMLVLAGTAAQADVTLTEKMSVEGAGLLSLANMAGTTTTAISGKRSRMDSDLQMQSRLARTFARGVGQTSEIVLLDADKVYELDSAKREYREVSLADRRAQLQKATEQARQNAAQQPAPTGLDESQCEWSEPTVEVTRSGSKANIAGFDAEQVNVLARQSCKDKKSGAVCDVALSLEEWVAPGFEAGAEVAQFGQAYAEQMGLASMGKESLQRAEAFFGRYKDAWSKVIGEMRNVKGYPVKTRFAMGIGGPACNDGTAGSSNGSSESPASPGALGAKIAGAIFGRKKNADDAEAAASPATAPAGMEGMIVPLQVSSEIVSVSRDTLSPATFQVPADYKRLQE